MPLVSVSFLELVDNTLHFDLVHTGFAKSKLIYLKNNTPKNITTYMIKNPFPENLVFKENIGYITDKPKIIQIIFKYNEENLDFKTEVPIVIRGGRSLILKITANIIQPEVIIEEEKFNFGGVCFNEMKIKNLTLTKNQNYL